MRNIFHTGQSLTRKHSSTQSANEIPFEKLLMLYKILSTSNTI